VLETSATDKARRASGRAAALRCRWLALALAVSSGLCMGADELPVRPSLEDIFRPPRLLGRRPQEAAVSADGRYALYRWTSEDQPGADGDLWLARTDGSERRVLFSAAEKARSWWAPAGAKLLCLRGGWLELLDLDKGQERWPLFQSGERVDGLRFVNDGARVVFSAGDDARLWVIEIEGGLRASPASALSERSTWFQHLDRAGAIALFAKASGGGKKRLHIAALEGGAEPRETAVEEGGRVEVSPDGRWAACSRVENEVRRQLVVPDYLTETVSTRPARPSLAGDPPGEIQLDIRDLQSGAAFSPALGERRRGFLLGLSWSPDGGRLLVERLSEDHRVRELIVVEPGAQESKALFIERDEAWIGGPLLDARWLPSGRDLLFTSEQSGFNHLYRVDLSGQARTLTEGGFEVQSCRVHEAGGRALLVTNEPDAAERHLAILDLETGARRALATPAGCVASPVWSADGSTVVYLQERLGVPGDLHALRLDGGAPARLTETVRPELEALALPPPEIIEYSNPDDGQRVRAFLYRPEPFDPSRRYPAVVFIHGAGYLQNVTRSMSFYDVNMLFHHRLARRGYVVLDADYRHSAGYGRKFRADIHGWMGGKDLDDVVAGVHHLESLGFVDQARVGVYGGSYGGFLTLMALFTKPKVFACGAALRSVTDWRSYHAAYTNPRLGSPKDNPENYRRSSPIDHAEGLERPLLLLHGLVDGNVFAQDTIRLVEKLIRLGKDFELMLYPSQEHAFTDPASWIDQYRRIERFFDRHLMGAAEARPRSRSF
jgi:dipeptidyl aminopeptidase/acylaminoacyl peptidase